MVTRRSYQQGYVSDPIRTRQGVAFRIRYRLPTSHGKWKHKSETLYGLSGKKAARTVLEERLRECATRRVEASEMTLREFVDTCWKPYLDRKNVKPSTRLSYDSALERHVFPALGDLRLSDCTPLHVENLIQSKLKSGLSSKTVRNLVGLLQGLFSLALDNDLISRSPVRNKHKPTVVRQERPIWTPEQVRAIVAASPEAYRALFVCATLTAARLGELLGLQWKNVDLEGRKLRIEQSLWQRQLLPPKTAGSIRTVPFGEALGQVLREHFAKAIFRGEADFVFCKQMGRPLNPDVLRKDVLYPVLDRLKIPRAKGSAGFHTFRHSAASFINSQTGNLKLAQKLLGHSNLDTTANVYTHVSVEQERVAALAVERAIYGENPGDLFHELFQTWNKTGNAAVN